MSTTGVSYSSCTRVSFNVRFRCTMHELYPYLKSMMYCAYEQTRATLHSCCHLVISYNIIPKRATVDSTSQLGAQEETPTQFPIQTVGFVWRWRQTVFQHGRDQFLDFVCD